MDSEVTNLAQVKAFDTTDYATSTQGTTADNALPKAGGTMTGTIAGFTSTGIDDNATSTAITIDASENVGIGAGDLNITADKKLHLRGSDANTQHVAMDINPSPTADRSWSVIAGKNGDTAWGGYGLRFSPYSGGSTGAFVVAMGGGSFRIGSGVAETADATTGFSETARFPATGGITFNGDTAAANALDDYETGTWTPSFAFGGASVGMAFAARGGNYTKVGNIVTATCRCVTSSKGTSVGTATLTGLPFTAVNNANYESAAGIQFKNINFSAQGWLITAANTTTMKFTDSVAAGALSSMDDTNFINSSNLQMTVTYQVA
jgi:hypothetical protein